MYIYILYIYVLCIGMPYAHNHISASVWAERSLSRDRRMMPVLISLCVQYWSAEHQNCVGSHHVSCFSSSISSRQQSQQHSADTYFEEMTSHIKSHKFHPKPTKLSLLPSCNIFFAELHACLLLTLLMYEIFSPNSSVLLESSQPINGGDTCMF